MRVALVLVLLLPATVRGLGWPGSPPCDGTLQGCITAAAAGETIEVASAGPVDEDLVVAKSLTLAAAAGASPVVGGSATHRVLTVTDAGPAGGAVAVTVRGLTLANARLRVELDAGSGHAVTVVAVRVTHALAGADGVHVAVSVPATVVVRDTTIAAPADALALHAAPGSGTVALTALANRVGTTTPATSRTGILVDVAGAGTVTAALHGNVITGVAGCGCPDAAGILVRAADAVAATVHLTNGTVHAASADALRVLAPAGSATATVTIFNTLVTAAAGDGIALPAAPVSALTVGNGYNDFFGNAGLLRFGGYPAAATTLQVDPFYADAAGGDLRLQAVSPLRNAGTNTPPGGLPATDAAGGPRVREGTVDVGAYEFDPAATTTTTTTTTTLPGGATTTTTLPLGGCPAAATYPSVLCRLDALGALFAEGALSGRLARRLGNPVGKAAARVREAQSADVDRRTADVRAALRGALRAVRRLDRRLRARAARRALGRALRASLRETVARLRQDLGVLRGIPAR